MAKLRFTWDEDTIEYFKAKNKPGCEGDYVRAITDFVHGNCTVVGNEKYQDLIEDLIKQTEV